MRDTANLKVGDEMEIVCVVNGTQSNLSIREMIFTNIMQDGAERNICAISQVPGFRYVQRVGWAIVAFSNTSQVFNY